MIASALFPPLFIYKAQTELNRFWKRFGEDPALEDPGRSKAISRTAIAAGLAGLIFIATSYALGDHTKPESHKNPGPATVGVRRIHRVEAHSTEAQVVRELGKPAARDIKSPRNPAQRCLVYNDRSTFDTGRGWFLCFDKKGKLVARFWAFAPESVIEALIKP